MTKLIDQLETVILGKRTALTHLVAAVIAGGHVLIEDLPGLGKTTLAKALRAAVSSHHEPVRFRRIQCTPDLLPYDITGVDVFDPGHQRFIFQPGPVFTNILLADEINRATPKVQSALLEVMAESQVTVGGSPYPMDEFFIVIATENPVEMDGTYTLPLAELDRFMIRLSLGYPDRDTELRILNERPSEAVLPTLGAATTRSAILEARKTAAGVHVAPPIQAAAVDIVRATREDDRFSFGASPRGVLMLVRMMQALALVNNRDYVTEDDLMELCVPVLAHRVLPSGGANPVAVIAEIAQRHLELLYQVQR